MSREALLRVLTLNPRLQPKTIEHYRAAIERWSVFADDLWTPMRAQEFYNHLLNDEALKPQSANAIIVGLRSVTKQWAAYEQDDRLQIFRAVQLRKQVDREQAIVLTEAQAEHLASLRSSPAPKHLRDFAIIVLGLQTGMRRMSFVGAQLEGLSFADATMVVPVKGGTKFKVPLSRAAMSALRPWVEWIDGQGIRRGPLFYAISGPRIATDAVIRPLTIRGFDEIVKRMASDVGSALRTKPKSLAKTLAVDDLTPHTFRHTFVTWCKLKSVPEYEIAAVTGHVLERSVGGGSGMIADVYTRRELAGAKAAEAITLPWMFRR